MTAREWTVQAVVERMKAEILEDVQARIVPANVRSFSALHDYVDANGYGGFFDEDAPPIDESVEIANAASDEVDAWIKADGIRAART